MGGLASAWFAIKYPDRIGRLAFSTTLLALPDEDGMAGIRRALELADAMKQEMTIDTVRDRMLWLVENPDDMTEELVQCRFRIYTQPGMPPIVDRTVRSLLSWLSGDDYGHEHLGPGVMEQISCPVMIVWTPDKPIWSVEQARKMASDLADGRFHLLSGGHWPQFERPEEWNNLHLDFFASA
jgi:2-hydroxy-6-oxonona-2,4-dienedioate hydrolase